MNSETVQCGFPFLLHTSHHNAKTDDRKKRKTYKNGDGGNRECGWELKWLRCWSVLRLFRFFRDCWWPRTHLSALNSWTHSCSYSLCSFACRCSFIKFYFHLKIRKIIERGGGGCWELTQGLGVHPTVATPSSWHAEISNLRRWIHVSATSKHNQRSFCAQNDKLKLVSSSSAEIVVLQDAVNSWAQATLQPNVGWAEL